MSKMTKINVRIHFSFLTFEFFCSNNCLFSIFNLKKKTDNLRAPRPIFPAQANIFEAELSAKIQLILLYKPPINYVL